MSNQTAINILSLAENEAIIEHGLEAYREAGLALKRIRDDRQYKATHKTFEAYCQERWHMGTSQAYRLIEAAETANEVSPIGGQNPPPATERVAREIKGNPEQKRQRWGKVIKLHGARATAEQTRRVVQEDEQPKPAAKSKPKPHKPLGGKESIADDPAVIEWVRNRYSEKWNRDDIVIASVNGTDGWPRPGEPLSNGTIGTIRSVIKAIERMEQQFAGQEPAKAVAKRPANGKVMRELRARKKAGDTSALIDTRMKLIQLTNELSWLDLPGYDPQHEIVTWELEYVYETLIEFQVWMDITTSFVQAHLKDTAVRAKIKHMRENTSGRTDHEIMIANKLADRLERKLDGDASLTA